MTWISKTITTFGLVLVAHAYVRPPPSETWTFLANETSRTSCYSAQEHSALQSLRATSVLHSTTSQPSTSLPIDISIETVIGLFITVLGLVTSTPKLRPIQWRVWAGKVEREGEQGFLKSNGEVEKDYVGNPFRSLETRPGFVDIRSQRKEFAEWVRAGGKI